MPKYYVMSGDLKTITTASNPKDAALNAFKKIEEIKLGKLTAVNEKGFDNIDDEDMFFYTVMLLEESGQIENFKINWK